MSEKVYNKTAMVIHGIIPVWTIRGESDETSRIFLKMSGEGGGLSVYGLTKSNNHKEGG